MSRRTWTYLAIASMAALSTGAVVVLTERNAQAQPNAQGGNPMQMRQRMMQPPPRTTPIQMLVHGDSLFLADREWLFQFDVETLEVKATHNLDLLRRDFMEKMQAEGKLPNQGGPAQ